MFIRKKKNRSGSTSVVVVDKSGGRLKYLHDLVFGARHEKKTQLLLWVPASNPYYKAGGVFESNEARNFSKIIPCSREADETEHKERQPS